MVTCIFTLQPVVISDPVFVSPLLCADGYVGCQQQHDNKILEGPNLEPLVKESYCNFIL